MSVDENIAIPLNKGATKFELNRREDGDGRGVDGAGGGAGGDHRVEINAGG